MTQKKTLEEEILLWALDGDTVNNLVSYAEREMQANPDYTIDLVRKLFDLKYLKVYLELPSRPGSPEITSRDLNFDLLAREYYVTLTKTDLTLPRLREIQSKSY